MDRDHFRTLVQEAVASLPPAVLDRIENVEIVIRQRPTAMERRDAGIGPGHTLLGLYQGVPLPFRGDGYNLVPPDIINIYQQPIEATGTTDAEVREQIRVTVLHEIAHYFGIDDDRLHKIGMG